LNNQPTRLSGDFGRKKCRDPRKAGKPMEVYLSDLSDEEKIGLLTLISSSYLAYTHKKLFIRFVFLMSKEEIL
jgi:hypothetical protein